MSHDTAVSEAWRVKPIVLVCAKGHPAITYQGKRGEPDPGCPACHQQSNGHVDNTPHK